MAAGDTKVTRSFLDLQADGTVTADFNGGAVKLALITSAHTPSYTGDNYFASLSALQVTAGTAYVDGGAALPGVSVTTSTSMAIFKATTLTFATDAAGFATARWGAIYVATGNTATSPVVAWVDLGSDRQNTAGPLLIYWTNNKIVKWTQ